MVRSGALRGSSVGRRGLSGEDYTYECVNDAGRAECRPGLACEQGQT